MSDIGWDRVVEPPASPESENGWADVDGSPASTVIAGGGWSDLSPASEGSASSIGDLDDESLCGDDFNEESLFGDAAWMQADPSDDVASVADDSLWPKGGRRADRYSHYTDVWKKLKRSFQVAVDASHDVDVGIEAEPIEPVNDDDETITTMMTM